MTRRAMVRCKLQQHAEGSSRAKLHVISSCVMISKLVREQHRRDQLRASLQASAAEMTSAALCSLLAAHAFDSTLFSASLFSLPSLSQLAPLSEGLHSLAARS